jgi:hypothetical protein
VNIWDRGVEKEEENINIEEIIKIKVFFKKGKGVLGFE